MNVSSHIQCSLFPCQDTRRESYSIPQIDLRPEEFSIVLISESAPSDPGEGYYARPGSLFELTTVQAFRDAGAQVNTIQDILALGVYLTSAVKCGKTSYAIQGNTIEACSHLLERELALFQHARAYLLMGDVAIKAFNAVTKRAGQGRVIPAGSTYKIRGGEFYYQGRRVFPSYLQAGPSFFIEKSKRRMIAEDIGRALKLAASTGNG